MKITSAFEACQVLGLPVTATVEDIKRAYKELCKLYHPDAQPDQQLHWQYYDIVEAYEYLMRHRSETGVTAPRVLGQVNSFQSSAREYAKWEKVQKRHKKEKEERLREKQKRTKEEKLKQELTYEKAMNQINAIRTARAIEAMLEMAKKKEDID